jgi:hypothetical protein
LNPLALGFQPEILFQDAIRFRHSRVILGEGLNVCARLAMNLAVLKRRFAAETIGNDMLVNRSGPCAENATARLALRYACNAPVLAATGERLLANGLRKFSAPLTAKAHARSSANQAE